MLAITGDATLLLIRDELSELARLDETWLETLLEITDDEAMITVLLDEMAELLFAALLATELLGNVVLEEELLSSPVDSPPQPTRSPSKIAISACFMCYLIPSHKNKYKGIVLPQELFGCDPIRNEYGIDVQFREYLAMSESFDNEKFLLCEIGKVAGRFVDARNASALQVGFINQRWLHHL